MVATLCCVDRAVMGRRIVVGYGIPSARGYEADCHRDGDGCLDEKDVVEWLPESGSREEHSHHEGVDKEQSEKHALGRTERKPPAKKQARKHQHNQHRTAQVSNQPLRATAFRSGNWRVVRREIVGDLRGVQHDAVHRVMCDPFER